MSPPARTGGHNSRAIEKELGLGLGCWKRWPGMNIADVPPSPGVYVFTVTEGPAINRVRGTSNIVYIGYEVSKHLKSRSGSPEFYTIFALRYIEFPFRQR